MMARMAGKRTRSGRRRGGRVAVAALGRPSLAVVLLFAGLMLASAFVAIEAQRNALAREAASLQQQIQAGNAQLARQQADIAEKQTDAYVIDKARDYGYVKPGEALIGVQRDALPVAAAPAASGPTRLQKWIALFFGIH